MSSSRSSSSSKVLSGSEPAPYLEGPGRRGRGRLTTWLALFLMCLGALVMVYPYLYAVGGSLKSRSEFSTDRQAIIPPRYQPARLFRRFAGGRPDPEQDRQLR